MKRTLSSSTWALLAASALSLTWFASAHVAARSMATDAVPTACRSVAGSEPFRLAGADIDDPISDEPPVPTY